MSNSNQVLLTIASGDGLDVRSFRVTQRMSGLFRVEATVVSRNPDIDPDEVLGEDAAFNLGTSFAVQSFHGVCAEIDLLRVESGGLATYTVVLVPRAWLMTQRQNYRIFQYKSELEIVSQLLGEWGVDFRAQCGNTHPKRKFRVQYAESDFDFACRMLEDAGISFWFEDNEGKTVLVLDDDPQAQTPLFPMLRFHDQPGVTSSSFATKLELGQRVRPGSLAIGDLDYRRASSDQPRLSHTSGLAAEQSLEQFDYEPGAFLYQGSGSNTPSADDRGATRTDEATGKRKTANRLAGLRQDARQVAFESDVLALKPGVVLSIALHPHAALEGAGLLVTSAVIEGKHSDDWRVQAEAAFADMPFRPALRTPKPKVRGLESATVVGPSSEEIHTDEYARVRVHFHWDRESGRDEQSSCWIPTNQPWAGAGFGGTVLPRIGQEVFVAFLGGDPDRPVVIGRTFTEHQPPPYPLPMGKTLTALIGKATPAMVSGGASGTYDGEVFMYQRGGPSKAFNADYPGPMRMTKYSDTSNMVMIEDKDGKNLVFLQAQKDLHMVIKNSWRTVVGNYRGCVVLGNDDLHVKNKQLINVIAAQRLNVVKDQTIKVKLKREERVSEDLGLLVGSEASIKGKSTIKHKAKKSIVIEAGEKIRLRVGKSVVVMDDKAIVIESPNVDINR